MVKTEPALTVGVRMRKRRTSLEDGRYLTYYSFGEGPARGGRDVTRPEYDHHHFHVEFYPPLRTKARLKYLAGSETGVDMFINDTPAEEKAAELRSKVEPVVWGGGGGAA
jgi:hypothetical protein